MNAGQLTNPVGPSEKGWYRVGGVSAISLAVGYVLIIACYIPVGAPPGGVEARLLYYAGHAAAWWGIVGLSVLTDLLCVPVMLALYLALKETGQQAMLLATACVGLFVALDLAVTWTNYTALITLGGGYAAASGAEQSVFSAAATYPLVVVDSVLFRVYTLLIPAMGYLITSLAMVKGNFGKLPAYWGVAAAALSIVSAIAPLFVSALGITIVIAAMLTTAWIFILGYRLCQLGWR